MSTLVTKHKTVVVYLLCTVLAVVVNYVYGLFGHGIKSDAMTWMFLYPLLGGALFYGFIGLIRLREKMGYRLFYNLYNSGIATLTVGGFVKGILEIAGTNSPYIQWYGFLGWGFVGTGFIVFMIVLFKRKPSEV